MNNLIVTGHSIGFVLWNKKSKVLNLVLLNIPKEDPEAAKRAYCVLRDQISSRTVDPHVMEAVEAVRAIYHPVELELRAYHTRHMVRVT